MKKLMGISVIAALAVLPVAANAAEGDQVTKLSAAAVVSSQNLATTSYVQGAYKAAADKVDAFIDSTSIATDGNYIDAGKDVAHNLGELDAAVKANETAIANLEDNAETLYQLKTDSAVTTAAEGTYTAITAGQGVGANLVALDSHVKTNEGAITTLNANSSTSGSVDYKVKNNAKSADYTNTTSGLTATTIQGAIDEVEGRVDTAESNITTLNANSSTSGSVDYKVKNNAAAADYDNTTSELEATTIQGAIDEVNQAVKDLDSTADATYQKLTDSEVTTAGNYITVGQGVGANLEALDTAVGKVDATNQYHIATANDVATNLETLDAAVHTNDTAIATINNKQIPIVADWSTGTVTQKKISELVTAAN